MNITLVQCMLDGASRSVNLQNIIRAIDEACAADPAPDVVVLPGAVDTGGVSSPDGYSEARLDGFRGLIFAKAREWGVYVGVGLHRFEQGSLHPTVLLIDPDGDIAAYDPSAGVEEGEPSSVLTTPIGTMIAICLEGSSKLSSSIQCDTIPLMIAPVVVDANAQARQRIETHIAEIKTAPHLRNAYWAVVMPVHSGSPAKTETSMTTFLQDPNGCVLAEADDRSGVKLVASLDLTYDDGRK